MDGSWGFFKITCHKKRKTFKGKKFKKGGEPDTKHTAKIVLMNWQRGEIPFMQLPPDYV